MFHKVTQLQENYMSVKSTMTFVARRVATSTLQALTYTCKPSATLALL